MLDFLRRALDRLLQAGLALCFSVLAFCVLWQVFSRYVLDAPAVFTEEVSRFAVIWLSMLGTAYACGRLQHMAYDSLAARLSGRALWAHMRAVAAIVLAFCASVFVYGGGKLVARAYEVQQYSATLQVPMAWVYACLPISGLCMVIYQLVILAAPERCHLPSDEGTDALAVAHAAKERAA